MARTGRPTIYSKEIADKICESLALGQSMRTVCADEKLPCMATVFKWLREKPDFLEQYTRAKEESADAMSEDVLDIADDGTNDFMETKKGLKVNKEAVMRSRLRVETRKWLMAKMKPKKYGDKIDMTTGGKEIPLFMPSEFMGKYGLNQGAKPDSK